MLERLVSRFGWEAMVEEGNIIGCKLNGQSVTLEPGGQFELSGAPLANLHQTCDEVNSHLYQAKAISEELGVRFLGVGFDPTQRYADVPMMPKNRYNIMRDYMPKVGSLGHDMMFRSCTIQARPRRPRPPPPPPPLALPGRTSGVHKYINSFCAAGQHRL